MLIIPAIDIKDGKCVRLRQGDMDQETVFSDDPVAMAEKWIEAGARRIHLVDLNGAFAGEPKNAHVVNAIADNFPDVEIQVGGGIRDANHTNVSGCRCAIRHYRHTGSHRSPFCE